MPVRADKSADLGIVIAALEVVEAGDVVVDIAAVAEGVIVSNGVVEISAGLGDIAPGIVGVSGDDSAEGIQNAHHIALQIDYIVVALPAVTHRCRVSGGIVGEVESLRAPGHLGQLIPVVYIGVIYTVIDVLRGPHSVGIVGKGDLERALLHRGQLSAVFPGVGPVAVGGDVANGIAGNGFSIVARQQVAPVTVAVGVVNGLNGCAQLASGVGIFLAA